ncbi:GMP/IMP nucleotidase [Parashewanella curva]|uniref:GMP/IMP nucleotidase n=1 Tax=Parashewanella curva TaxID=2338552 RepID=A0A3L8PRJ1_9GAMM|nr:GMP/IMP nucleotidase [Parashewanella curva]RLV57834.1 GMP/IMP nucleotidase [Parashewanella curva]
MLPWQQIDAVLLDMDGTLLDLHFDNHLWLKIVPQAIASSKQISVIDAQALVEEAYEEVAGTLNWYCLDYWQQRFDIDIVQLHESSVERIVLRDDCMPFLHSLKTMNKPRILATNAHPTSLALKLKHTELGSGLDHLMSSHETGYSKEDPRFWPQLFERFDLTPSRCLFVDDNEHVLAAAKKAGIGFVIGVENPDSQLPNKQFDHFDSTSDLRTLIG